jgi:hypothetical protein
MAALLCAEHAKPYAFINATLQLFVQLATSCSVAQLQKVQCNATPPYRGVAVLH